MMLAQQAGKRKEPRARRQLVLTGPASMAEGLSCTTALANDDLPNPDEPLRRMQEETKAPEDLD